MKISEAWLREWVNPALSRDKLCNTLTMAGLEVEDCSPAAGEFKGVVVGQVLTVIPHPNADQLRVCTVTIGGKNEVLQIVCGAPNVVPQMKVAVAKINAVLPHEVVIIETEIRGVTSQGMLCSASELGISEQSDTIIELSADAPLGKDLRNYLQLNDYIIDLGITPNRGDCLSARGLAREISALTMSPLTLPKLTRIKARSKDTLPITLKANAPCGRYLARVISHVDVSRPSPIWMQERLRRSGIRTISGIVDVTNYVMLELGQPMHAFDLQMIQKGIQVRLSKQGEKITLLDDSEPVLDGETLVIADHDKPLAIAGVMGGIESSVTEKTTNILLESAFFAPTAVARARQRYGLASDSAYRFERGVDPTIQMEAMERATQLILEIAGGVPGPVVEQTHVDYLPKQKKIKLAPSKIDSLLGISISNREVNQIFNRLQFQSSKIPVTNTKDAWNVSIPLYRFDVSLPEDLIEEIARLYGYDKIPETTFKAALYEKQDLMINDEGQKIRQLLKDRSYHEIVSYSFIDSSLQQLLNPSETPQVVLNPITNDMTVMRTNLWPGLIKTLLYNQSRQQDRIRLFEFGTCFVMRDNQLLQQPRLAGILYGPPTPEQWGIPTRKLDFYDIKGDVEYLLKSLYPNLQITFAVDDHPVLHPGQAAGIYIEGVKAGVLGALHPSLVKQLGLSQTPYVFELSLDGITPKAPLFQEISKFPEIRRDLALVINQAIPVKDIQDTIRLSAGDWLKALFIFDVYQGKGISPGLKSVAIGLVWQHPSRTLVDEEVAGLMERVVTALKGQLGAELRS